MFVLAYNQLVTQSGVLVPMYQEDPLKSETLNEAKEEAQQKWQKLQKSAGLVDAEPLPHAPNPARNIPVVSGPRLRRVEDHQVEFVILSREELFKRRLS